MINDPVNLLPAPGDDAWTTWAALPQFAARSGLERVDLPQGVASGCDFALALHVDHFETYGRWKALVADIEPERHYEFRVWQRTLKVDFGNVRVPLILTWCATLDGKEEIQRDYVGDNDPAIAPADGWHLRHLALQAPPRAKSVRVELGLRWAPGSSVWWLAPRLVETVPPPARKVRIATTRICPPENPTVGSNITLMADLFDQLGKERPDLVLFSENLVDRGVRRPLEEVAQTIPGPLTEMLSKKARHYRTYAVTTLHEVDHEGRFYNTAVLIDREGGIAGKYRKVHLTMSEAEKGILPGNDYGLFDTDFGRVGLAICWDNWFSETARLLRLRGAEIILLPIAGDGVPGHWDVISRARAFDNSVFLVSSATFNNPSQIINPAGEVVAEVGGDFDGVVHEIDLNQQWRVRYLSVGAAMGEARSLYLQERRPDTYRLS